VVGGFRKTRGMVLEGLGSQNTKRRGKGQNWRALTAESVLGAKPATQGGREIAQGKCDRKQKSPRKNIPLLNLCITGF